ncbi:MAG: AraC family transcriptional regulator [Acidobacteriota bacterium]
MPSGSFAYATLRSDLVAERLLIEQLLDELRGRQPAAPELALDIRRLLHAIHEDPFDSDLSVRSLKQRCRIRDNNVSSRFRFVLGVTIRHYIEILRLEAAVLLLTRLEVGVFDIALSIGYQNPQTFYNAFRRCFDCTPSDFRQQCAESEEVRVGALLPFVADGGELSTGAD